MQICFVCPHCKAARTLASHEKTHHTSPFVAYSRFAFTRCTAAFIDSSAESAIICWYCLSMYT